MERRFLRYILVLCLTSFAMIVTAQTRTYKVRPGDSYSSVAARYGVTEQALRELNPKFDDCYVGLILIIPDKDETSKAIQQDYSVAQSSIESQESMVHLRDAIAHYESNELSKAIKSLNKSIRLHPTGASYYYRGMSHYGLGHWKQAVEDLKNASLSSDLTAAQKNLVKEYLKTSVQNWDEKKERNKEIWASVGMAVGGAVLVAGAVAGAVMLDDYVESNSTDASSALASTSSVPYRSSSASNTMPEMRSESEVISEFTQGANQILVTTIAQQQINERLEYENYCKMVEGAGMTRPTIDEWRAMQGAAIMQMKEEGYDIIAEQREINRQNREEWRASLDADRQARLDRIKEYNDMRYGTTSSSSSTSTSSSSSYSTTSSSSKVTPERNNSSNTYASDPYEKQSDKTEYDSHQQFKSGTLNASSSDYRYIKKVTLYRQDGSDYKVSKQNVELYEKGAQQFIKIGNTYYLSSLAINSIRFHKKISYGSTALFFND